MRKLLSLPPNLVGSFHDVTGLSREEFFTKVIKSTDDANV